MARVNRKVGGFMVNKLSLPYKVRNFIGWLLAVGGMILFIIYRRQTLPYDIGIALGIAAYALRPAGSYLFLPVFLFLLAVLLHFGSNGSYILSLILIAVAFIIGVYRWRENRGKTVSNKRYD